MGFVGLMVMSFLQLHGLLDADEHCVGTSYKIVEILVGAIFCCGCLGGLECPLLELSLLFWMRSPCGCAQDGATADEHSWDQCL